MGKVRMWFNGEKERAMKMHRGAERTYVIPERTAALAVGIVVVFVLTRLGGVFSPTIEWSTTCWIVSSYSF
jgi:hypothetical protein